MGWIQTYSGHAFDYSALAVDGKVPIDIEDIAHGLAHLCRFCGQCKRFYSVAEHSCLVRLRVRQLGGNEIDEAHAMLHDGTEAYLQDIPSPLKYSEPMWWYRELERRLVSQIYESFGLPSTAGPLILQADKDVLECERLQLLGEGDRPWEIYSNTPANMDIVGLSPVHAKKLFLENCEELGLYTPPRKWWNIGWG